MHFVFCQRGHVEKPDGLPLPSGNTLQFSWAPSQLEAGWDATVSGRFGSNATVPERTALSSSRLYTFPLHFHSMKGFVLFWLFSISKSRGVLTMLKFHMWRRSVSYFGIWTRKLANQYIVSAYAEVTSPAAGRDAHLHSKFHLSKSLSPQSQDWYYNYFPPKTLERHNPLNEESHFDSDLK